MRPAPLLLTGLLIASGLLAPLDAARTKPVIRAGLAQTDITPPLGVPMYGYASRETGAEGILDSLRAIVLYLESEDVRVALVSMDVGKFRSPWLHDQAKAMGLDQLILLSSHTHAGPRFTDDFPASDQTWQRTVEERIAAAIKKAMNKPFPAFIAAGEGTIQLGYNRLRRDPDGLATTFFENHDHIPYGPVDPTVAVIRITDGKGRIRAALVHYAMHPVVLGSKNMKLSADYVGVMARGVEAALGGGALCLFAQGGCGDINPLHQGRSEPVDYEQDYSLVIKVGKRLAEEVIGTLARMEDRAGQSTSLQVARDVIAVGHRWEKEETLNLGVVSLLLNDEIGIVAIPGEPFHTLQTELRSKAALPYAYMFGYADIAHQDWPSYLPDVASAARGGYGASDSGTAELGTGERLINQGLVQLYTMRGMLFPEPRKGRRP